MKLFIPAVPPSLNEALRLHWRDKHKLQQEWIAQIRAAWLPNGHATTKMRVKITLCHSRFYDKDNAFGAVKPVVDALRHWHILVNDTAEWLELAVEQEKCSHAKRHTIIELEKVEVRP